MKSDQQATFRCAASFCLAFLALSSACSPPPASQGSLAFDTIERKDDPAYIGQQQFFSIQPGLVVMFNEESAVDQGDLFSEQARLRLARVNWQTHFAVAAFQGWQTSVGYGVDIQEIRIVGGTVRVQAAFQSPGSIPGPESPVTSPYHLILVSRAVPSLETMNYELVVASETVAVFPTEEP